MDQQYCRARAFVQGPESGAVGSVYPHFHTIWFRAQGCERVHIGALLDDEQVCYDACLQDDAQHKQGAHNRQYSI
ncbi:MAG: hypothetical protein OHK0039_11990 [Bacteroidia bacterium]